MSMLILFLMSVFLAGMPRVGLAAEASVSAGSEEGLSVVGGTSYGDDVILELGSVTGEQETPEISTLRSLSPTLLSKPGSVLGARAGMYAAAFATDEPSGVMTGLQMTISDLQVEFDQMTPGILGRGQTQIVINSNVPIGYTLYAAEDLPLHLLGSEIRLNTTNLMEHPREVIEQTTCDDGSCNYETAASWVDEDVPGFGYTVMGSDALGDFDGGNKYKAFADLGSGQEAQPIAREEETEQYLTNRQVNVQYQVGVKGDNEVGVYYNHVNYTLVPNF